MHSWWGPIEQALFAFKYWIHFYQKLWEDQNVGDQGPLEHTAPVSLHICL